MTREERVDWLCRLRCWVIAPPLMTAEQKSKFIEALTETINTMQTEPCEDCISRQAVLSEIGTVCFSKGWREFRADYGSNGVRDYIIEFIEQMPSIQPEPKTGKWNKIIEETSIWREAWHYECSNCGNYISGYGKYKYCPNCGAKMESEE